MIHVEIVRTAYNSQRSPPCSDKTHMYCRSAALLIIEFRVMRSLTLTVAAISIPEFFSGNYALVGYTYSICDATNPLC